MGDDDGHVGDDDDDDQDYYDVHILKKDIFELLLLLLSFSE